MRKEQIGLLLGIILFALAAWVLPFEMPQTARYTLGATMLMSTWWITEALPLPITALLPLILFPTLGVMTIKETGAGYSNEVIYLFLGGFMIAIAIEHWNLHKRIALNIITRMGGSLSALVGGFILAVGFLSMWISNTAAALMMLPIGLAVVHQLEDSDNEQIAKERPQFAKALILGIAYSASIGGIATLVGTPTNMVFSSFMKAQYGIEVSFASWMLFALPATILLLIICWLYLTKVGFRLTAKLDKSYQERLQQETRNLGAMSYEEKWVLGIFGVVAFFWITRTLIWTQFIPTLTDTAIGLVGAMVLFIVPSKNKPEQKLMSWEVANKLPWDVILLFGGGLSLAEAFEKSGLAIWIGAQLSSLEAIPFFLLFFLIILLMVIMTEFTSNVAAVSMLLPILAALGKSLGFSPYGMMIGATCAASAGFMMPMGTAANALAFGTGYIKIGEMIRAGFWLDVASVLIFTIYTYFVVGYIFG